jgi:hypothetical protein
MALALAACSGNREARSIELLPGIVSRQGLAEVKRSLNIDESRWQVVEDTRTPTSDKRPFYHYMVLSIRDFPGCATRSDAILAFFNDRLLHITCYPENFEAFITTLADRSIANIRRGDTKTRAGAHVFEGTDPSGRRFVTIEDPLLREELNNWIKRYS